LVDRNLILRKIAELETYLRQIREYSDCKERGKRDAPRLPLNPEFATIVKVGGIISLT
jgi:hypothetical protein